MSCVVDLSNVWLLPWATTSVGIVTLCALFNVLTQEHSTLHIESLGEALLNKRDWDWNSFLWRLVIYFRIGEVWVRLWLDMVSLD